MSLIQLRYGPYESFGVVRHRSERLRGIIEGLKKLGIEALLVPSIHWDRLEIEAAGRIIFTCRITFLPYNDDGLYDPLCQKALNAVTEFLQRLKPSVAEYLQRLDAAKPARRVALNVLEDLLGRVVVHYQEVVVSVLDEIMEEVYTSEEKFIKQILEEAQTTAIAESEYRLELCQMMIQHILSKVYETARIPMTIEEWCLHLVEDLAEGYHEGIIRGLVSDIVNEAIEYSELKGFRKLARLFQMRWATANPEEFLKILREWLKIIIPLLEEALRNYRLIKIEI